MRNVLIKLKPISIPVFVLAIGFAVGLWFVNSRPQASPKPPQEKIWPVSVVTAVAQDVQPEISVFGQIRAAREAELRAMVAGRLVSLNPDFIDGNLVTSGTELAIIDPVDYENRLAEQRAELAGAQALLSEYERELQWEIRLKTNADRQVELARRGLERNELLQRSGGESKKARDDAETALATSVQNRLQREQTIGRLRARVVQQQAAFEKTRATLAIAERELARTRVIAPFDGYVTDVKLALGKLVAIGESLGRLLSSSDLEARFDLPEADYARLSLSLEPGADGHASGLIGRQVTVIWRLGDAERRYPAHVARIGAEIDVTLGGIELMATVDPGAPAQGLRAGAFVEIRVLDRTYRDVYRLPAQALSSDGNIYVVRDGRLEPVVVQVERELGSEVLVRADLDHDETVVARIFAGIGPGLLARPL